MRYTRLQIRMFQAATTLAFFGLLRSSEYVSQHRSRYDSRFCLLRQDVWFNYNFSIMYVRIKASKTDPFRSGCIIRVASLPNSVLCPVTLMLDYLRVRSSVPGPLFVLSMDPLQCLVRQDITVLLNRCLPSLTNVNTHSFRIGGASAAAAAGIADSQIRILGRWSSNVYQRYLHLSDDTVRNLCEAVASENEGLVFWDPNTLCSRR